MCARPNANRPAEVSRQRTAVEDREAQVSGPAERAGRLTRDDRLACDLLLLTLLSHKQAQLL